MDKLFLKETKKFLDETYELLVKKSVEYDAEDNKLKFFYTAANIFDTTIQNIMLQYMAKQFLSLINLAKYNKYDNKDMWNERIADIINYALILHYSINSEEHEK